MPNPTSKLNLVINGTTTQLDIHDANAVDLTSNQTVAGNKEFVGTTTAHDLVPSATDTYNFGSPSVQWNNAYIKSLTINGTQFLPSDYIPRSGGAVITGISIGRVDNSAYLNLCGGLNWSNGATVSLLGKDAANDAGGITLHPNNGTQEKTMWLKPNGTWTWNGTACQITSDQRLKQQITEIDDKLLDAWGDVDLVQFKYNDAVDAKKDKARLHTGYVVQQIDTACKKHGVDVSQYGLYCHEEYPQETEEVEVEQEDGTKTKERKVIREANEHYSLRYTEVYAVECMYLRRCIARLTARIEELEKGKEQEASK